MAVQKNKARVETKKLENTKLVEQLHEAKGVASHSVIRSHNLKRNTRESLTKAGFLSPVIKGWFLLSTPAGVGTTTLWYSQYWNFVREYLKERFGQNYCLGAETSLEIHSGNTRVPAQITVITKKKTNETVELSFGTSLLLYQDKKNFPETHSTSQDGLEVMRLEEAICRASPTYFVNFAENIQICLKLVRSPADISAQLLEMSSVAAANRVIGAYRELGENKFAEQIEKDLAAAGFNLHPVNPFVRPVVDFGSSRLRSPYVGRLHAMWFRMRLDILKIFPHDLGMKTAKTVLKNIEELKISDAYHSLSIEGYQVSTELIEKIQKGLWDAEGVDQEEKSALAAKGYSEAFLLVKASVEKVLAGENAAKVLETDLQDWYRTLFSASVKAGLIKSSELAGYRRIPVYIKGSRHIPLPHSAVVDAMEELEKLLQEETSAAVRAILGHFIFVFIHPYVDGNGRIARFILNLMLVSGGYNWTIIRTTERTRYMSALEKASVEGDITPFAEFVFSEMQHWKKSPDHT